MTQAGAREIADEWTYDGPYAFYNMKADPEDYAELVDETQRNRNDWYEAVAGGQLAGFFCVMRQAGTLELGLGLRPELCGKGLGKDFLRQILTYLASRYHYDELVLSVAVFNRRAIRVYRACGFQDAGVFRQKTNGGVYEFLKMKMCGPGLT